MANRRSERILKLIGNLKKLTGNPRDITINSDKKLSIGYLRTRKPLKFNNSFDDELDGSILDKTDPVDKTYYPSSQDESGCSSGLSSFIDQNVSSYDSDINVSQAQHDDENDKTWPGKCDTDRPSKSATISLDEYVIAQPDEYARGTPNECSVVQLNECDIVRTDECTTDQLDKCTIFRSNQSITDKPYECNSAQLDKSTTSLPGKCASIKLEKCASAKPDENIRDKPDECNATQREDCATNVPGECASFQPDKSITDEPDECNTAHRHECVTSLPNDCASVQPGKSATSLSDECASTQLDKCASVQPNVNITDKPDCAANVPSKCNSVLPDESITDEPDECNIVRRGKFFTSHPYESTMRRSIIDDISLIDSTVKFGINQFSNLVTPSNSIGIGGCDTSPSNKSIIVSINECAIQPDEYVIVKPIEHYYGMNAGDKCKTAPQEECTTSLDECVSVQPDEIATSNPNENTMVKSDDRSKTHTHIPVSDLEDSLIKPGREFNLQRYIYPDDYHYYMRLSNTDDISLFDASVESGMNRIPNYAMSSSSTQPKDDYRDTVNSEEDSDENSIYKPSSCNSTDTEGTEYDDEFMLPAQRKIDINYNINKSVETIQKKIINEEPNNSQCGDGANSNKVIKIKNKRTQFEIEAEKSTTKGICKNGNSNESQENKIEKRIRHRDFCFFCEQQVLNFARHVMRNHTLEPEVQKALSAPKKSKYRKMFLTKLRKKGNYILNAENCVKPMKKTKLSNNNDYLPCPACLGFYSRKQLWKHKKICGDQNDELNVQAQAQNFLLRNLTVDHRLKTEVFHRMRPDKISLEAKKDSLICAFGAQYLRKHREKHFISVTSRKMRELAKLIMEIKKIKPEVKMMIDTLKPQYYDTIVMAAKNVAQYDTAEDRYESPTYAMNISTSLKQCCNIALMETYKTERSIKTAEIEADLKTLTILIESHWKFDVSSRAADDLNIKKWNKTTIVPLANDLKVLKEFLCNTAKQSTAKLVQSEDVQAFNDLVETIYCRVILLNRRRPGELQRVLLSSYENNDENDCNKYEEFDKILTTTEKILVKTLKRIVIRGKRGRGVPVLFSTDVQNDLSTVIGLRSQYVPEDNKYLFSKAGGTVICGYKVLEKHAKMSGAKNPKSLTATRLRKHLATLTQLFDMSETEMEQLATFMGHTMSVHKQNYRLPSDVFQTAKISKLLLLMEDGKADIYHGKTLDEIDLNLDEDIEGEEIQNEDIQDLAGHIIFDDIAGEKSQIHMEPVEQAHSSVAVATENDNKKRVFTSNVKDHGHQNTFNEPTTKKKRVLVPWTTEQKQVVSNYFRNHIKNKKPPKRNECEVLKELYGNILENKDWLKIKVFVQNVYTSKTK